MLSASLLLVDDFSTFGAVVNGTAIRIFSLGVISILDKLAPRGLFGIDQRSAIGHFFAQESLVGLGVAKGGATRCSAERLQRPSVIGIEPFSRCPRIASTRKIYKDKPVVKRK